MANNKPFASERIAQCLGILDQWRASGMSVRIFATAHQCSYDHLRAWLRHESRWRASLPSMAAPAASSNSLKRCLKEFAPTQFAPVLVQAAQQVQEQAHTTVQAITLTQTPASAPMRIECTSSDQRRSATVYFQSTDVQASAQWLAAYLSA